MQRIRLIGPALVMLSFILVAVPTTAQVPAQRHLVLPNLGEVCTSGGIGHLELVSVHARVTLHGTRARTDLDLVLRNDGGESVEAVVLVPVGETGERVWPSVATQGGPDQVWRGASARGELLDLHRSFDSSELWELAGHDLLKLAPVSVAGGATKSVRVSYTECMTPIGNRVDYALYRSASAAGVPWSVEVMVDSTRPIGLVHSSTHALQEVVRTPSSLRLETDGPMDAGSLHCSVIAASEDGSAATILVDLDTVGPGAHFMLVAAPVDEQAAPRLAREVTLVLDRSGSMKGLKLQQVRAAALSIVQGLREDERFRIVDYADAVACSSAAAVEVSPATILAADAYLQQLEAGGSTNLEAALAEALRPEPASGLLPVVLFMTDGLATKGFIEEPVIRERVLQANLHKRRVYTLGVGYDVNAALLDSIASATLGRPHYVRPTEDIEEHTARVANELAGPLLTDVTVRVLDGPDCLSAWDVRDLLPRTIGDVYAGERLVLVGETSARGLLRLRVTGRSATGVREFNVSANLNQATEALGFVTRIWAQRRVGELTEELRLVRSVIASRTAQAERITEVTNAIMRLSAEHGILTEYTSFLARSATRLSSWSELVTTAERTLVSRAVDCRVGAGAVNQSRNLQIQGHSSYPNFANCYVGSDDVGRLVPGASSVESAPLSAVGQIPFDPSPPVVTVAGSVALRRGRTWIDARVLLGHEGAGLPTPSRTVIMGSAEFVALLRELAEDGRSALLTLGDDVLVLHRGRIIRVTKPQDEN